MRRCAQPLRYVTRVPLSAPTDEEIAAGAKCPAGYVLLPNGTEAEWLRQLVGEQLVTVKTKRGFTWRDWQKLRERNEALDCRVYARAAAWIAGADRWTDVTWQNLEKQIGALEHLVTKQENDGPIFIAGMIRRNSERRRRVFHSSYLD
jgi:phage terminase large subunit GpA-like protein